MLKSRFGPMERIALQSSHPVWSKVRPIDVKLLSATWVNKKKLIPAQNCEQISPTELLYNPSLGSLKATPTGAVTMERSLRSTGSCWGGNLKSTGNYGRGKSKDPLIPADSHQVALNFDEFVRWSMGVICTYYTRRSSNELVQNERHLPIVNRCKRLFRLPPLHMLISHQSFLSVCDW